MQRNIKSILTAILSMGLMNNIYQKYQNFRSGRRIENSEIPYNYPGHGRSSSRPRTYNGFTLKQMVEKYENHGVSSITPRTFRFGKIPGYNNTNKKKTVWQIVFRNGEKIFRIRNTGDTGSVRYIY
jgi:hypothetical protein